MTRIILAIATIALVFSIACGGDKKDGGLLGGGGSAGGGSGTKDPVAFAQSSLVTMFNMFGGSVDPQRYLDLYLPECRTGVKVSDVTQVLTMVKAFFPEISKLKIDDIDLGNPKVERNGSDIKLTITDSSKLRVKVNGKFIQAEEYFKSIGFKDPKESPLEVTDEPLLLKEQDGRLFIANCDDLQDLASSGPAPTPTPQRSNPTPTPQRPSTASPTPGRGTSGSIGREIATPARGTPVTASTAGSPVVRTTPTAAQRYPADVEKNFMDSCQASGGSTASCRCALDIIETRYTLSAMTELERNLDTRRGELTAIISTCSR